MPQTFVALQCAFCEAYQVTLDKASKKFSCAICCQKQSFKKIHAISNSAKDCRKVVQELNELRGARDRQLGSEETAAALEHAAAAAAAGCPASDAPQQALGWEEFAELDDNAGNDDDDWLAGTGEFVTTLPDSGGARGRGGKRRGKTAEPDDDAPYKQPRYGQGRGKQHQQQAYHGAVAPSTSSSLGACRPPAQLQRVPQQHPHQQQSRQPPIQRPPPLQQQHRPWQLQQQQRQQAVPASQQHSSWQPQQQQPGNGHWSRQGTLCHGAAIGTAHTSGAGGCGAAWLQSQAGEQVGSGAAGNRQQSQQQHPQQRHPQQQQQPWLKPPLGSNTATVKQQPQQQGGPASYSRAQQQQQRQLPIKAAGKPVTCPLPAAAGGAPRGAWGAFVDEDGPGACSSEEEECIVDGQGVCCLQFTGPEVFGFQSSAAAPSHHGTAAAARWS